MEALVKQLVDQLGLDDAVAKQAVEIGLGVLKDKLPAPLGDQLEDIIEGGNVDDILGQLTGGKSGGIAGLLGGLFGNK